MASTKRTVSLAALALLAFVCHAATRSNAEDERTTTQAITMNSISANGDDTASIPDFDGDGTIGFGDFVKFAEKFGLSQGDVEYDAQFDLNDDGEIGFADFLIFAENFGKEVTVHGAGDVNKMYWTDRDTDKIQRSNLDGSGVEDLVTSGLTTLNGIALDVAGGKMYWTDRDTDKIQRSNLDGSGVEDLVTTGLVTPSGIALDVAGGKMYWTDWTTDKIQRSNLDGSGVEDLVTRNDGFSSPRGIALDAAGGKMYWTVQVLHKIQRSNLDGSGVEDLVTTGLGTPWSIALDLSGGKMYWADYGEWERRHADKIQRSNLDGSNVETSSPRESWTHGASHWTWPAARCTGPIGKRGGYIGPTWTEAASKTSSRDDCSAHAASRWILRPPRPGRLPPRRSSNEAPDP